MESHVCTISRENPPANIKTITAKDAFNTPDNARAGAPSKLRLRQEFPQNYAEVRYPFKTPYNGLNSAYGSKTLYMAAIGNGNATPDIESAALLMIALSHGRGGVTFNIDEIGPTQIIDVGGKRWKSWSTSMTPRSPCVAGPPTTMSRLLTPN